MNGRVRRGRASAIVAIAVLPVILFGWLVTLGPGSSTGPSGRGTAIPLPTGGLLPSSEAPGASIETGETVDIPDRTVPDRIDLYAGAVSITPGEPLALHVSTRAASYTLVVARFDASMPFERVRVATVGPRPGRDERRRATIDSVSRTVRANWPVSDVVATAGFVPGIYFVTGRDSNGTVGQTIFVVRSPTIRPNEPLFVFSSLTYEAYNLWGGANLYDYGGPEATRVSFDRPYLQEDGLQFWQRGDDRIVAWLQRHNAHLQYTTDYDLSVAPPPDAPRLVIFGRHTEYVGEGLRDWVERHVNGLGDMNVANFGSNSFYTRVRLESPEAGGPQEIVCYRKVSGDPVAMANPREATVRWRDPPLDRPEGAVLGAQYVGIINGNRAAADFIVGPGMPADLLAGTGWTAGTTLRHLLVGEGDDVFPGSGGIAIMGGQARYAGRLIITSMTIRTSPAGARVFDAGTFAWGEALAPKPLDLGVRPGSFDRFMANVLAWLGLPLAA